MKEKLIKNTAWLIILCFVNVSIFSGCKKENIFDAVVTKPVVIASDHPVFSHDSGIYPPGTNVTITCTTPNAVLRYTDDGTDPKTSGTAVTIPFPVLPLPPIINYNLDGINNHTVIKAYTFTPGMWDSDRFSAIVVKSYTMEKAAAPVLTLAAGQYVVPPATPTTTITSLTVTAGFRYTTDGSDPNTSPTAIPPVGTPGVPQPFTIDLTTMPTNFQKTVNLRIISVAPGYNNSDIVSRNYEIKVADPTTNAPASATYNNDQTGITMTNVTTGSLVYYTLDGTIPALDAGGNPIGTTTLFTVPITINKDNTQLRIRAFKTGCTPSDTLPFNYQLQAATPALSPGAGAAYTGNDDYNITMTTGTTGAEIRYTVDNSPPTAASTLYTVPIPANLTFLVRAKAFRANYQDSIEASRTFNLQVGALTVNPATLTQNNYFNLTTMTTLTAGATIVYTLDGSVPTLTPILNGTIWTGAAVPITVNGTNVRVIGFKANYINSVQINRIYTLQVNLSIIAPVSGTYNNDISITLNTATSFPSAPDIYYRLDGVNPTSADIVYLAPFNITTSSQLRARGFLTGFTDSVLISRNYVLQVANPIFSLSGGTFNNDTSTTITDATTGSTIFYTTDGSDPAHDGAGNPTGTTLVYVGALTIDKTMTIKAVGWKTGYNDSAIIPQTYTMVALDPTFAPAVGGPYPGPFSVTLNTGTLGSTILYTNDGSNPTHDGLGNPTGSTLVYSGAIPIAVTTVLRFMVYKTGYTSSITVQITVTESGGNFTVSSP